MKVKCVVKNCITNKFTKKHFTTYPFPKKTYNKLNQNQPNLVSIRRIKLWVEACGLPADFDPESNEARVCSRHFLGGKPAKKMEMNDIDWIPSLNLSGEYMEQELEEDEWMPQEKVVESGKEKVRKKSDGGVSLVSLEKDDDNVCTMMYDEKTGDLILMSKLEENIEIKSPTTTQSHTTDSSHKKKPKILNRDAPKDDDEAILEELPMETAIVTNDEGTQTEITMERLEELENFWNKNYQPPRKSVRNKKQVAAKT